MDSKQTSVSQNFIVNLLNNDKASKWTYKTANVSAKRQHNKVSVSDRKQQGHCQTVTCTNYRQHRLTLAGELRVWHIIFTRFPFDFSSYTSSQSQGTETRTCRFQPADSRKNRALSSSTSVTATNSLTDSSWLAILICSFSDSSAETSNDQWFLSGSEASWD